MFILEMFQSGMAPPYHFEKIYPSTNIFPIEVIISLIWELGIISPFTTCVSKPGQPGVCFFGPFGALRFDRVFCKRLLRSGNLPLHKSQGFVCCNITSINHVIARCTAVQHEHNA